MDRIKVSCCAVAFAFLNCEPNSISHIKAHSNPLASRGLSPKGAFVLALAAVFVFLELCVFALVFDGVFVLVFDGVFAGPDGGGDSSSSWMGNRSL